MSVRLIRCVGLQATFRPSPINEGCDRLRRMSKVPVCREGQADSTEFGHPHNQAFVNFRVSAN